MKQHLRPNPDTLICRADVPECGVLTVSLYDKWYSLFVVHHNGVVEVINFDQLEHFCAPDESAYLDHAPNPWCVQRYADTMEFEIEPLAFELMIGRWELEHEGNYQ